MHTGHRVREQCHTTVYALFPLPLWDHAEPILSSVVIITMHLCYELMLRDATIVREMKKYNTAADQFSISNALVIITQGN